MRRVRILITAIKILLGMIMFIPLLFVAKLTKTIKELWIK
jgi:hypothetical protein